MDDCSPPGTFVSTAEEEVHRSDGQVCKVEGTVRECPVIAKPGRLPIAPEGREVTAGPTGLPDARQARFTATGAL